MTTMDVDLVGLISQAPSKGPALLPVFEAISNSLHAAEERGVIPEIVVVLHRQPTLPEIEDETSLSQIECVTIKDNGCGFNEENFSSFNKLYSRHKATRGGKGLGRLKFLERFESVEVTSCYQEQGVWKKRSFQFRTEDQPVQDAYVVDGEPDIWETTVKLKWLKLAYREDFPKRASTVARKIVDHFLEKFLQESPPSIRVIEEGAGEAICASEIFRAEYEKDQDYHEISLDGWTLSFHGFWTGKDSAPTHEAVFCAHGRAVASQRLSSKDPLFANVTGPHGFPIFRAYISGELLDNRVDQARTSFDLDRDEADLQFSGNFPTWTRIVDTVVVDIKESLEERFNIVRRDNFEKTQSFVSTQYPEFYPLIKYRRADIERISTNTPDDRRYAEMQRLRTEWRIDVDSKAAKAIADGTPRCLKAVVEEVSESCSMDLAQYVMHRKWIIGLLSKSLEKTPTGRYPKESQLHDILWPMRTQSDDDVWYDPESESNLKRHNLWLIDERLAFHAYLASDKRFDQLSAPFAIPGDDARADILVFDTPTSFVESRDSEISSVTVLELKRPERDDDDNPIDQVYEYCDKIRSQGAVNANSGRKYRVSKDVRFYCYICANLTDHLVQNAKKGGFKPTSDSLGYYFYNESYSAYVEILDWQKVLIDATKRNRPWFDVAGLRK